VIDLDIHLAAIINGDAHAFACWMAGCETRIRDSLRSFASVVDVEAVLQEALVRVWQVAPRFEPDGRPNGLVRFAIRIARNLAVSELRRTKSRPALASELESATDEPTITAPDPLLRRAIADCRAKLPPKPREAFDARLSGGDDTELAEAANMRLNTFLQNFTRARQLLAECLRKRGIAIDQELAA
jgi:RNA polymerase sigma-70 factor (ECF subfamily)